MDEDGIVVRVTALHRLLREHATAGASVTPLADALAALAHIDGSDRRQVRAALATTMVTSPSQRHAFDVAFDLLLPASAWRTMASGTQIATFDDESLAQHDLGDLLGQRGDPDGAGSAGSSTAGGDRADRALDDDAFAAAVVAAIRAGDDGALLRLAEEAVDRYAAVPGRDGTPAWFSYRVRRALDPAMLRNRLNQPFDDLDAQAAANENDHGDLPSAQRWQAAAQAHEHERMMAAFTRHVDAEIRRRNAAQRGADEVARRALGSPLVDRDFFTAASADHQQMRDAIRPLARRLATRMALRRRSMRRGPLDVRRTVRASLATGGVPVRLVRQPRRRHRQQLVVLCDVSGSVASFTRFTLLFVLALQEQWGSVRTFAFIDAVDEVTGSLRYARLFDAADALAADAQVVAGDGHSDYGRALQMFHAQAATTITPKTTVLILGDARNNYRQANAWVLADLRRRARRIYWLNPEPRGFWNTGDSIAAAYARHVEDMVEVRNLRQLAAVVERIGT